LTGLSGSETVNHCLISKQINDKTA